MNTTWSVAQSVSSSVCLSFTRSVSQSNQLSVNALAEGKGNEWKKHFNQLIKKCQSSRQSTFAPCVVHIVIIASSSSSFSKLTDTKVKWRTLAHTHSHIHTHSRAISKPPLHSESRSQFQMQLSLYEAQSPSQSLSQSPSLSQSSSLSQSQSQSPSQSQSSSLAAINLIDTVSWRNKTKNSKNSPRLGSFWGLARCPQGQSQTRASASAKRESWLPGEAVEQA